jgi:hypothetical protein
MEAKMADYMFTVSVVCYGDYPDRAVRAIRSIAASYGKNFQFIVCANECGRTTINEIRAQQDAGIVDMVIQSTANRHKDPMLRLVRDACETPFLLALDDDAMFVSPEWNLAVEEFIQGNSDMAGAGYPYMHPAIPFDAYIAPRPWNITTKEEYESHYGTRAILFPTGAMVLYSVDIMRKFDFPDRGRRIKWDDLMFGELMRQHKLRFIPFHERLAKCAWIPTTGKDSIRTWKDHGGTDAVN